MRVVFVSNFLNHHQLPFSEAMLRLCDPEGYRFVATTPFDLGRLSAGYEDMNLSYPWVIRAYDSASAHHDALEACGDADVAVMMPECIDFQRARLGGDRITFIYSERILKRGLGMRFLPAKHRRVREWFSGLRESAMFYQLCAGAYVSYDLSLFGLPVAKCYKWGYFPSVSPLDRTGGRANHSTFCG